MIKTRQPSMFAERGSRAQRAVDDICANNHKGNEQSAEANRRGNKAGQLAAVLAAIRAEPARGMTADECAYQLGLPNQSVSARFSELKECGLIFKTGMTRPTRQNSPAMAFVAGTSNLREVRQPIAEGASCYLLPARTRVRG